MRSLTFFVVVLQIRNPTWRPSERGARFIDTIRENGTSEASVTPCYQDSIYCHKKSQNAGRFWGLRVQHCQKQIPTRSEFSFKAAVTPKTSNKKEDKPQEPGWTLIGPLQALVT